MKLQQMKGPCDGASTVEKSQALPPLAAVFFFSQTGLKILKSTFLILHLEPPLKLIVEASLAFLFYFVLFVKIFANLVVFFASIFGRLECAILS